MQHTGTALQERKPGLRMRWLGVVLAAATLISALALVVDNRVTGHNGRPGQKHRVSLAATGSESVKQPTGVVTSVSADQGTTDAEKQLTPADYRRIFKNDLFLGDSITDSLTYYDYLDSSNAIAGLGFNFIRAEKEVDRSQVAAPDNIFIMLGANDAGLADASFQKNYGELLDKVRLRWPKAKVYLQSLLPVAVKADGRTPYINNARFQELNTLIRKMARQRGLSYLDVASVLQGRQDLYEPDGVHFQCGFCSLWLDYLIKNAKQEE